MLTVPPAHPLAPQAKTAWFHLRAHDFDHVRLSEARLCLNRVKGGFVIPRHGDNFRRRDRASVRTGGGGDEIIREGAGGIRGVWRGVGHAVVTFERTPGCHDKP